MLGSNQGTYGGAVYVTGACNGCGGTGGYAITWPGSVVWPSGTAPSFTTTAGTVSIVTLFTIDGGTTWYCDFSNGYA